MKEYLKEQNMRRENDPVSTTLDVGLNNNQLVRESQSPSGSEDTENENFWVTDGVGLSANYEWCCESNSSVDDLEGSSSEYGWDEDSQQRRPWTGEITPSKPKSDWQEEPVESVSGGRDDNTKSRESRGGLDNFWNKTEPRDDNEFNNNDEEAVLRIVPGDSVNQLDARKNEEKIFYEKPKLNIQTVTYLYDSVLPPTEKCMNYVNSIKVSQSLVRSVSPPEDRAGLPVENSPEVPVPAAAVAVAAKASASVLEKSEKLATTGNYANLNDLARVQPEVSNFSKSLRSSWSSSSSSSVDVEVVELSTSVRETLQFAEIEEISDSVKSSEVDAESNQREEVAIEHIDLIREARELPLLETKPEVAKKASEKKVASSGASVAVECSKPLIVEGDADGYFEGYYEEAPSFAKLEEIDLLSSIGRDIGVDLEKYVQPVPDVVSMESVGGGGVQAAPRGLPAVLKEAAAAAAVSLRQDTNKLVDLELPDVSSGADARKKEKMARNQARRRQQSHSATAQNRRPDKRRADHIADSGPGGFDVYNIETAMPKIDLDAIESHLRAAREEERREDERVAEVVEAVAAGREPDSSHRDKEDLLSRFNRLLEGDTNVSHQRRNDREEIRRRLAMGPDAEDLRAERGRKPSLQSRLQSGMNLQICFMNETPSDTESPGSENDSSPGSVGLSSMSKLQQQQQQQQHHHSHQLASRPQVLSLPPLRVETGCSAGPLDEADFFARQARLQTEARMALAQAKEMAHMQMEVERQRLKQSPITEMVRSSLEKVGVQLGEDRRRLSRVLLTELNVAQLQVVANDLHARIATLNEALVEGLLRRDDLHMEQDSMLVDVEDLTRYLGAKQESLKKRPSIREQHQHQHQRQQHATGSLSSRPRGGHQQTPAKTSISREKLLSTLANRRAA